MQVLIALIFQIEIQCACVERGYVLLTTAKSTTHLGLKPRLVVAVPNRARIFILFLTSSASCLQYLSLKLHYEWCSFAIYVLYEPCMSPALKLVIQHFEHCNAHKNTNIWLLLAQFFSEGFPPHVVTQLTNEVWRAGRLVWAMYYHHVQAQLMKPACSTHLYCQIEEQKWGRGWKRG